MGKGQPTDPLDAVCKAYKQCLKCARTQHGEMCIGESAHYRYGEKYGVGRFCDDNAGSCSRDLCECDLAFAKAHMMHTVHFNRDKHFFWSTTGWDPLSNCSSAGPGSPADVQCCQAKARDTAWSLYNADDKVCCRDGSIGNLGDQC